MPTAEEQVFIGGADLTPTFGANAALIEQAIELATTTSYRGLVIYSDTTPTTSGEPSGYPTGWYEWHKRCLWLKPTTGEIFRWNGTTWALAVAKPGSNTIGTSAIIDDSVTIAKLNPDGGQQYQVLRINVGETAFEYIDASDLFGPNEIAISKIAGTSVGSYMLTRSAASKSWTPFDSATIIGLFGSNEFPVDSLARGSALQVPMVNAGGTAITWSSVVAGIGDGALPLTKLQAVAADAGKYLRRNPTTGVVESVALSTPSVPNIQHVTNEITTLPSAGSVTNSSHGLTAAPTFVVGNFVCVTADAGYSIGDVVDMEALYSDDGSGSFDFLAIYTFSFNATNVTLTATSGASVLRITHKTNGTSQTFTPANWKFRYTATRYY